MSWGLEVIYIQTIFATYAYKLVDYKVNTLDLLFQK